jgi:hypothetical protein
MAGFDVKSALQMPAAVTIKKFTGIGQIGIPPGFYILSWDPAEKA